MTADAADLRILALLQSDARLTAPQLAARTGESAAAVRRRVARLEQSGVIRRYKVVLDPAILGFAVRAFVFVRRSRTSAREDVLAAIVAMPEVVACHIVSGEHDFLVELLTRDMQHFADATLQRLAEIPGVVDHRTTFAISTLVSEGDLPLHDRHRNSERTTPAADAE